MAAREKVQINENGGSSGEAANLDTVYRDLYLRRARQLLSATLDESAYRAIGSSEKEIEDLMRRSRSAVLQRDWGQAAELSAQADGLRQQKAAMGNLVNIGKDVYDADTVAFDPFSPENTWGRKRKPTTGRAKQLMDTLASLAKLDPSLARSTKSGAAIFPAWSWRAHSFAKRRSTRPRTGGAARHGSGGKGRRGDAAATGERTARLEGKRDRGGFCERVCRDDAL